MKPAKDVFSSNVVKVPELPEREQRCRKLGRKRKQRKILVKIRLVLTFIQFLRVYNPFSISINDVT